MTDRLAAIDRLNAETDARLRDVQARITAAEAELAALKQERHGAISEAIRLSWSHARIGESLGLSKQRVQQLWRTGGGEGNGAV